MKTAWTRLETKPDAVREEARLTGGGDTVLLDSCGRGRYTVLAWDPVWKGVFHHGDQPDVFRVLDDLLSDMTALKAPSDAPPFLTGVLGCLGYELAWDLERIAPPKKRMTSVPDAVLMIPGKVLVTDGETDAAWVTVTVREGDPERELEQLVRKLTSEKNREPSGRKMPVEILRPMTPEIGREEYMHRVLRVQEYIGRGDIYQANLAYRVEGEMRGDPRGLFEALRKTNPGAWSAFLRFPGFSVLSSSPEQFLRWERGFIETRPIKGTRPRGENPAEDRHYREELKMSEKDRAELVMIVDLERNDFGKFCKTGSIRVPELFTIEAHPTVWHQVARVTGRFPEETGPGQIFRHVFPGGSITGAPKLRSMQVIHEVEKSRRGFYTGSIGYADPRGTGEWNIAIRTMTWTGGETGTLSYHVGGGIVADSDPLLEYEETRAKGRGMEEAIRQWAAKGMKV
ncbi:para-aminobenzoate synthetase component 1 [Melghirimyces profundicolus]|uniref:aminodeoxychorismate synthase n=1 Tax=Melghirimyces profundicolus TaxID=1242148 RepID=A0A2T6BWF8_9BACL|nr:aminodeoxychorismate synthase component I [Melghirimyces profundicolus]PTX60287.1 para-aminobenzoate synthetase component 1 [Melghirimyces profundicolus]